MSSYPPFLIQGARTEVSIFVLELLLRFLRAGCSGFWCGMAARMNCVNQPVVFQHFEPWQCVHFFGKPSDEVSGKDGVELATPNGVCPNFDITIAGCQNWLV